MACGHYNPTPIIPRMFFFIFIILLTLSFNPPMAYTYTSVKNKSFRSASDLSGTMNRNAEASTSSKRVSIKTSSAQVKGNHEGTESSRIARNKSSVLPWQESVFKASAHEVPSGPNPISNR